MANASVFLKEIITHRKYITKTPVEVAKEFEAHGIHRLHIVDLDGAASRHVVNYRVLDQIASRTSLVIDFGGGIKTDEDLVIAFDNGAQMVTLGSVAVKNPGLFKKMAGTIRKRENHSGS